MTDEIDTRAERRKWILRLILPHVVIVAIAAAAAVWVVLYVMKGDGGKETAVAACESAIPVARRTAPFAKGEVAAMNVAKTPKPMTEISFDGPDGKPRTLADFRGKTVLLNLWATWCVPCRKEMPALDRLQAQAGGPGFEVVAVNIDTARLEKPKAFLNEIGVKSLAWYADHKADIFQRLKQTGQVLGLPTTILIDGSGCALGVMAGPAEWDSPDALALVKAATGRN